VSFFVSAGRRRSSRGLAVGLAERDLRRRDYAPTSTPAERLRPRPAGYGAAGGRAAPMRRLRPPRPRSAPDSQVNCAGKRATPDVSLDADPASGRVRVRQHRYNNQVGWWVVGGTSASSPMWAARSAVGGRRCRRDPRLRLQHLLPRHHERQQRRLLRVGFRPLQRRGSWIGATP